MTLECCLRFPSLPILMEAVGAEGFVVDTSSGAAYSASTPTGTFIMVDDCGSGCRWDAGGTLLSGAYCCFYPAAGYVLPASLEQYAVVDVGNCCGLA